MDGGTDGWKKMMDKDVAIHANPCVDHVALHLFGQLLLQLPQPLLLQLELLQVDQKELVVVLLSVDTSVGHVGTCECE